MGPCLRSSQAASAHGPCYSLSLPQRALATCQSSTALFPVMCCNQARLFLKCARLGRHPTARSHVDAGMATVG